MPLSGEHGESHIGGCWCWPIAVCGYETNNEVGVELLVGGWSRLECWLVPSAECWSDVSAGDG